MTGCWNAPPSIKKPDQLAGLYGCKCLTMSYSHMGNPTLPSALNSFTAEFGMGSGGTYSLLSSGKLVSVVALGKVLCDGSWRRLFAKALSVTDVSLKFLS